MSTLQTLDRGLRALELVSLQPRGTTVADLARDLDIHRAICYRIVATLEERDLVVRSSDGRIRLGAGVAVIASRFAPQLQLGAGAVLDDLAERTGATAHLSTAHGDSCVATMVTEPSAVDFHVGYRIGSRHPLRRGAAGIAILAMRPETDGDPDNVREARRDGVVVTRGQLERGAVGVAAGVRLPERTLPGAGLECSVGVVALGDLDLDKSRRAVVDAARNLAALFEQSAAPTSGVPAAL